VATCSYRGADTMSACARHENRCAYPANDHTRCSFCHRSWRVITGRDSETAAGHVEAHLADDARRAVANTARAASRGVPGRQVRVRVGDTSE
jgi:hypothetical protein